MFLNNDIKRQLEQLSNEEENSKEQEEEEDQEDIKHKYSI